jgi:hypothetical protein
MSGVVGSPTPKYKLLIEPHLGSENLIYKNLSGHQKIPDKLFAPVKTTSRVKHIKNASVDSQYDHQNSVEGSKELSDLKVLKSEPPDDSYIEALSR